MRRSWIGGIFIDHPSSSFAASVAFWSAATARPVLARTPARDPCHPLGVFGGEVLVDLRELGEDTPARFTWMSTPTMSRPR